MGFIKKYIEGREYKWLWFISTLIGGALPIVMSVIFSLSGDKWDWNSLYSAVDVAFLGLSMNISNFNLLGNKNYSVKDVLTIASYTLLTIVAVHLGYLYSGKSTGMLFLGSLHVFVLGSIFLSHSINVYVFKDAAVNFEPEEVKEEVKDKKKKKK